MDRFEVGRRVSEVNRIRMEVCLVEIMENLSRGTSIQQILIIRRSNNNYIVLYLARVVRLQVTQTGNRT